MTGHRPFAELRRSIPPERRTRNAEATQAALDALTLYELRRARATTQEDLARTLQVGQSAVAKLERRADMYVSNLQRYVEALGGRLEIRARFPDGEVTIRNIGDLAETETPSNS